MTWKTLFDGNVSGTNAALPSGTSENVVIYTVPAGKTAFISSLDYNFLIAAASITFQLYILPNGATDTTTTTTASINGQTQANTGAVIAIGNVSAMTSATYTGANTRATILSAGDAIKVHIANGTVGAIDDTAIVIRIIISGMEF